jgi:hypothetical protein
LIKMKTSKRPQYLVLVGIGLLTIVVLVLVSSPSSFLSPMVTIDTSSDTSSPNQVNVITKTDFSDPEEVKLFPYDIGKWHGRDYDTASITKELGANYVLLRGYDPETFTQPLFLNIVQSKTNASFHDPAKYCFPSQGYQIQEKTIDSLFLSNSTWIKGNSNMPIPLNKLVVTRNSQDDKMVERRLVLYFFVKGNQLNSDMVTMIEVQGLVPLQGAYDGTMKEAREFLSQSIPLMFEPVDNNSQWHPLAATLADKGAAGYFAIAVLVLVPLSIVVYPFIRRRGQNN